jgi:hypothetical protein
MDGEPDNLMRCPTCNAEQAWSDVCRRCKSDLTLLRELTTAAERLRGRALRHLRAGRRREALRDARESFEMHPRGATARLLAVCQFLNEDWDSALATAEQVDQPEW